MKQSKLEIQTEFEESSIYDINKEILILKFRTFISTKLCGFLVATMCILSDIYIDINIFNASLSSISQPISLLKYVVCHIFIFIIYMYKTEGDLEDDDNLKHRLSCMNEIKISRLNDIGRK